MEQFDRRQRQFVIRTVRKHLQHQIDAVRQFQLALLLLVGLLGVGAAGYVLLEGMTVVEGLYMTVITLTTVGFGEVRPLSEQGRVFTMILILLGVSVSAYALRNAAEIAVGDRLWLSLGERDVTKQLETISNHFIICGYGRMGREIANEFQRRGEPFVIVDQDEAVRTELLEDHMPHVIGDATMDEALMEAGIERAQGLLAVVNSDADNVLIVLSAKGLNSQVKVVARAATEEMERKLRRAGADSVTSPYVIGGQRMAFALVRPAVYDFLNTVVYSEELHIEMGQLRVRAGSPLVGRNLRQTALRSRWDVIVVAIVEASGRIVISPDPNRLLDVNDTLIVVAPTENLKRLENGENPL